MTVVDLLRSARTEALRGQFQRAAELSRTVLVTHPQALLALRILAWSDLELAQQTAAERFEACLAVDPEDAIAEVGLGLVEETAGRDREALAHFTRAYSLDPTLERTTREIERLGGALPTSHTVTGMRALREGDLAVAANELRKASALKPPDPAVRLALALAIWQLGGRQQIENICVDILSTHPNCLKALLLLLVVASEWKRSLQMRDYLARIVALDPGALVAGNMIQQTGLADRVIGMATAPSAAH